MTMKRTIAVVLFVVNLVNSTPCSRQESVDLSEGVGQLNGSIVHGGVEYASGHWYELVQDGETLRFGCPCLERVCLWKCCSGGQAYLGRTCNYTAFDSGNSTIFNPPIYKGKELVEKQAFGHFHYMYNIFCEDGKYLVDTKQPHEEIYLQENGTLLEVSAGAAQWHRAGAFCLDKMADDDVSVPRLIAGVCYAAVDAAPDSPVLHAAYAVGLVVSVPFLLGTLLVYAYIPELRNLHGLCLMAYCAGLVVAYPLLAYLKLYRGIEGVHVTGCLVVAFIVYFAFQTSFFWLNVMCFDIWRTFSGYRGGGADQLRERRRFIAYGAYAWGVPLALTAVTAGMNYADVPENIVTPGFGHRFCWFTDWLSQLAYFYAPVLALVVCNVAFFCVTAHRIRAIKQQTAILKGAESSRNDKLRRDTRRYGLYLKLFLVMGVNWSVELISFAFGGSNWYWIVVDFSNLLLGFFIFLIFVWKNKVRNLVRKKWRQMTGAPPVTDSSTMRSTTLATEDTRISSEHAPVRMKDLH